MSKKDEGICLVRSTKPTSLAGMVAQCTDRFLWDHPWTFSLVTIYGLRYRIYDGFFVFAINDCKISDFIDTIFLYHRCIFSTWAGKFSCSSLFYLCFSHYPDDSQVKLPMFKKVNITVDSKLYLDLRMVSQQKTDMVWMTLEVQPSSKPLAYESPG